MFFFDNLINFNFQFFPIPSCLNNRGGTVLKKKQNITIFLSLILNRNHRRLQKGTNWYYPKYVTNDFFELKRQERHDNIRLNKHKKNILTKFIVHQVCSNIINVLFRRKDLSKYTYL